MKPEKKTLNTDLSTNLIIASFVLFALTATILSYIQLSRPDISGNIETKSVTQTPQPIMPQINSPDIPNARVGNLFTYYLIGTIATHTKLELKTEGLPEGMIMSDCTNEQDVRAVPVQPNTLIRCLIKGTPIEAGSYSLTITILASELNTSNSDKRVLTVEK